MDPRSGAALYRAAGQFFFEQSKQFIDWALGEIAALVGGDNRGETLRHLVKVGAVSDITAPEMPKVLGYIWDWFLEWALMQVSLSADQAMTEIISDMQLLAGVPFRPAEVRLLCQLVAGLRRLLAENSEDQKRPRPLF